MLVFVYNLSIISCSYKAFEEENIDAKLIKCVDINEDFVDIPFIEKMFTYNLKFFHREKTCLFFVDFNINNTHDMRLDSFSKQLVKCAENIGMNSFERNYEIKLDEVGDKYWLMVRCLLYKNGKFFREEEENTHTNNFPHLKIFHKQIDELRKCFYCMGNWIESNSNTQFRRVMGIKENRIKTTLFKFIFHITFTYSHDKIIKIIVETFPFSFYEDINGILFLNKEVKHQRCGGPPNA
ncbi:hypothetical protein CDIK_4417 [Cucumispora dikerogammari]|nr:hypothetical protein CDIK_4417 [Cucumispora dikerogammari]